MGFSTRREPVSKRLFLRFRSSHSRSQRARVVSSSLCGVQLTRVFSMRSDVRYQEDSPEPLLLEERDNGYRSSS